nr:SNF2-related protein [uncultured Dongia sp.]
MSRTYGAMELDAETGDWVITALEPHVAIRLKQIFPRIQKASTAPFRIANRPADAADLDWFLTRYPLAVKVNDRVAMTHGRELFHANQAEMERILHPDYVPPARAGLRPGQKIRPYQSQAVDMLGRAGGLLCGDEVGLGKTYEAGGACLLPDALPAVIVCQAHLQSQWAAVLGRLLNLSCHQVKKARPYTLPAVDVLIFRYTQLYGWVDYFKTLKPGLAAFDEIQELRRGTEANKGIAAKALCTAARYRLGLTATPIYNYGNEIWTIMEFLRPDVLGPYPDFMREWCPSGRISDPAALGTYLREQYAFLRRTKHDVGQQMPAVNRLVEYIDTDAEAIRSIDEVAHQLAIRATTGEFTDRGKATRELDLLVRQQTGIAKAHAVATFARIIVEGGEPIVLIGWHRDVYDIWLAALHDLHPAMYTGTESTKQKDDAKARFIAGETDILILSLRSGAGLDGLQFRSSTVIFGELDWSPGVHHQCIGRLDRDGQKDPVTAIFLVSDEGSDPPMMEVLGLKASEAAAIVDPGMGLQAVHSDVNHMRVLVQRYLDRKGKVRGAPDRDAPPPAPVTQQASMFEEIGS